MSSRMLLLVALGIAACGGDSSGPPKAGPPATLTVVSGSGQSGESGAVLPQPLTVKVADANGRGLAGVIVTFTIPSGTGTLSASRDTSDSQGLASVQWTLGGEVGNASVEARVLSSTISAALFTATVNPGAPASIVQVSDNVGTTAAGFDLYDSVAVRVVDRFGHGVPGATVDFAITEGGGSSSAAAKTTDSLGIARTAWTIGPSGAQTLRASSGSLSMLLTGVANTCPEATLAVGEAISLAPGNAPCLVVNGSAQRYVVSVSNTSSLPTSYGAYRVRGASPATTTAAPSIVAPVIAQSRMMSAASASDALDTERALRAHERVMQANYELMDRLRATGAIAGRRSGNISASVVPPNIGDIIGLKIPKNFSNLCDTATTTNPDRGTARIGARVVYVGPHSVMLEDTANPVKNTFDPYYTQIGQEFDNVMWPILTNNFGDPLAMDSRLNNTGAVYMVFSKVVNAVQSGGIAGFVSSTDFYPISQCPSSNQQATFYARVPTSTSSGFDTDNSTQTPDEWLRSIRTVVMHETKHVASFAEKFAHNGGVYPGGGFATRDQWLEESSAMLAEELWARTVFGYAQYGNVDYNSSLYCEVRPRPTSPECQPGGSMNPSSTVRPASLIDHFFYLYNYDRDPEGLSIVGPVGAGDFTFYGAGWMFLRWVVDEYASSEPTFLTAMTQDIADAGVDNIVQRTGKSFSDLLAEYSLALALDDFPGLTPLNGKLALRSWNTVDIFSSLNRDFANANPPLFTSPAPLNLHPGVFGRFAIDVSAVHGGGISYTQVTGTQSAKQLFEFKGALGTPFPAELRISVARVQ